MKPTLPTNYKDDILNTSVEGMRRYQMIYNSDNTVSFKDVTPYDQTGSDFGAGDINLTNEAVNQSADAGKIIDDPNTAEATTEEGYIAGVQLFNHVNDSLGDVSTIGGSKYKSIISLLQKWIDDGILTDPNMSALIPIMTGTSSEVGTVFASSDLSGAYKVFDNNDSTQWLAGAGSTNNYIGFNFNEPKTVKKILFKYGGFGTNTLKFQASNDNSTWTDLKTLTLTSNGGTIEENVVNEKAYNYYRLYTSAIIHVSGSGSVKFITFQMYGN